MNDMVSLYKEWPLEIQMSRLQIRLRVKQMTSRFLIFSSDIYDVLIQIESSEVVRIMRIHCRVVPVFSPFFFFFYIPILCIYFFASGFLYRRVLELLHDRFMTLYMGRTQIFGFLSLSGWYLSSFFWPPPKWGRVQNALSLVVGS